MWFKQQETKDLIQALLCHTALGLLELLLAAQTEATLPLSSLEIVGRWKESGYQASLFVSVFQLTWFLSLDINYQE